MQLQKPDSSLNSTCRTLHSFIQSELLHFSKVETAGNRDFRFFSI